MSDRGVLYLRQLRSSAALAAALALLTAAPAAHAQQQPRAVIELFTSQGCSSCPAADELLGEMTKDPGIIVMSLPIDYWDYLGWKDTLANPKFSARQRAYSVIRGDRTVYTPQAVINGLSHAIGSNKEDILRIVADEKMRAVSMFVPVTLSVSGDQLSASVGDRQAAAKSEVWLCAVSRQVKVAIGRGENSGRQIIYHNVVRRWLKLGDWNGKPGGAWTMPLENIRGDGVDAVIVYVQQGSRQHPGAMLGASITSIQ